MNDDGSVNLATSCTEIGSGSNTVFAQITSEILGIEPEKINVVFGDTENCPMGWGLRASRNTAVGGMAVKLAAEDARNQILRVVGEKMEIHPGDLEVKKGRIYVKGTPSISMTIAEAVRINRYRKNGQAIMAKAHWDAPGELADKVTGRGNFSFAFSFGAKAIEVEVDPGTGKVEIVQVAAAQDVGRAINPLGVECQIEGGVHMGLGYALTEEIMLDPRGRMINDHLVDYKILTPLDMPPVEFDHRGVDRPHWPIRGKRGGGNGNHRYTRGYLSRNSRCRPGLDQRPAVHPRKGLDGSEEEGRRVFVFRGLNQGTGLKYQGNLSSGSTWRLPPFWFSGSYFSSRLSLINSSSQNKFSSASLPLVGTPSLGSQPMAS